VTAFLEVNEAVIWATQHGSEWWNLWRARMEPLGRIEVITPSLGGDRVRVACDSPEDAAWLLSRMTGSEGIPKSAVKVARSPRPGVARD
jgi:hypothetical protein